MSDTKVSKRLARLEKAVAKADKKRKKLKRRVEELELVLEELTEDDDEDDDQDDEDDEDEAAEPAPVAEPVVSSARHLSEPDSTWTVARLREAATSRGLTGVSRMSKPALLSALTAPGE